MSNLPEIFVILTDDGVDQIVEGAAIARREVSDLKRMGCNARSKRFVSWADAEAYQDRIEGRN